MGGYAGIGIRVGAHNTLITPLERDTRRGDVCSPRSTLNVGRCMVWVAASQMGDSEVRGAGGGKGVLTAAVTGYM